MTFTSDRPRIDREALTVLLGSSPHCAALGLEVAEADDAIRHVALILPARAAHRLSTDRQFWHPGAISSALDTVLSMAALTVVAPGSRPATVDLRWEMFEDAPLGDLRVVATAARATPEVVFVRGDVVDARTGAPVGQGQACIAYAPPANGGGGHTSAVGGEDRAADHFSAWLDLQPGTGDAAMVPYREALGGAAGLPFWHGGALTAAMTAAAVVRAEQALPGVRLMTATASFNLFAIDEPILLDTSDWRATRTRVSVYVGCAQEGRGVTSRLAAHFGRSR